MKNSNSNSIGIRGVESLATRVFVLFLLVGVLSVVLKTSHSTVDGAISGVAPTDGILSLNFLFTGEGCDSTKTWCYNLVNNTGTLTVRFVESAKWIEVERSICDAFEQPFD